ncbi:MAG: helix-turn-helix domain-containing protein, partial [Ruminiclostridium sp.]|nr:helix-turn-helix domain-containing protein [Ruminiclostridium sp.]
MKHLSLEKLSGTVVSKRKAMKLSQSSLAKKTGINRSLLSRLETLDYTPSVDQLLALSEVLEFDYRDMLADDTVELKSVERKKIAVAGMGYVGLSLAVLLSQHNDVTAVDILPEKVEKLNNWQSPIQDDFIEQYLAEHDERKLSLSATTDGESAYKDADYIIVAVPTNYDPKTNFFDCSAVETVLELIKVTENQNKQPVIVIKSTIPVGYTAQIREKTGMDN